MLLEYSFSISEKIQFSKSEGNGDMAKFIPRKFEKEVISMRISSEVLEKIDGKAAKIGISRNELLNQCIQFALDNMEDNPKND